MLRRLLPFFVLLLLGGCATPALVPPADPLAAHCLALYAAFDESVAESGVTPSYPVPVAGFPHLRVDRFLASYGDRPLAAEPLKTWLERLAELDRRAQAVELASLAPPLRARLAGNGDDLAAALDACSRQLQVYDLADPVRLAALRRRAEVPAGYRTLNRVVGLYPLTAIPVRWGVRRWHEETRAQFATPLEALPVRGRLRRYRPPDAPVLPARLPHDALGIPAPDPADLENLFAVHAPVWELDLAGSYDRPGAPYFTAHGTPAVDPTEPVVYRYSSYSRWQGRARLQLNYVIWFARRPREDAFDLLAGALDGLVWRVTLDDAGRPLLYDSIHPCGCWHLFFPTAALRLQSAALALPEPPLVPQYAPPLAGDRMVVRVESGTHYVVRVYADEPSGEIYTLRDYRELYAVPAFPDGRRSLFDPSGLVPGTERPERWLLWPMGVPSPGAMRERGRHATAFVGRRHFDDPDLLEALFEPMKHSR